MTLPKTNLLSPTIPIVATFGQRMFYCSAGAGKAIQEILMRTLRILSIALFASLLLTGCATRKKQAADPTFPATANMLTQVRMHAQHADRAARVGLVTDADSKSRLVAVSDINPADFAVNQNVSFVDPRESALTSGTIVRILSNSIHVRYDPPTRSGARAPRQGDIMIRFKPAP